MKTVEVSESALESLKAMAQRLQDERDEAIKLLDTLDECYCEVSDDMTREDRFRHSKVLISVREFLAKCTQTQSICDWQEKMPR